MRRFGRLLALVALGAGFLFATACGDKADYSDWCGDVEELISTRSGSQSNYDAMVKWTDLAKRVQESAPDEVKDDFETTSRIGSDSPRISEQEEYKQSQSKINSFVAETCDLDLNW